MLSWIKLLKIVLPVATVATATVATVSLVSFRKADEKKNADDEDKVLDDFELQARKFEEKTMLYSKDGQNEPVTLENDALKDKILEKFKEGGELGDLAKELPDPDKLEKLLSEVNAKNLEKNIPADDSQVSKDRENKDSESQTDSPLKGPMPEDTGDPSGDDNHDATEIQKSEDLKQDKIDQEIPPKNSEDEKSGEKGDDALENKEQEPENMPNEDDGVSNVERDPSSNPPQEDVDEGSKAKGDSDEKVSATSDDSTSLQVKEEKDNEEASKLNDSHTLDQEPDEKQSKQLDSPETGEGPEVNGAKNDSESDVDSGTGNNELSPDAVKRLEDLLGTVSDVALQLQTLVIDNN